MVTPRIKDALNDLITLKGRMMEITLKYKPHITFMEALPSFNWYRHSYNFHLETLAMARQQAIILQAIIKGVPCFYMKQCQENNFYPITKWVWNGKQYVCYRQKYHYENHKKVITWRKGGEWVETQEDYEKHIAVIVSRLNLFSYLASLSPMMNNSEFNLK